MAKALPPGETKPLPRGVSWQFKADRPNAPHFFVVRDPKNHKRITGSFARVKDGLSWADGILAGAKVGTITAGRFLFSDVAQAYLDNLADTRKRPEFIADAKRILDQAMVDIKGDIKTSEFAKATIRHLNGLARVGAEDNADALPLSPFTINRHRAVIAAAVHYVCELEHIPLNPMGGVGRLKEEETTMDTLTLDQVAACLAKWQEPNPYFLRFALLVYLGVREGEGLHLRWADYDSVRGTIKVRRQPALYNLKTGERTIPVPLELREILLKQKRQGEFIVADQVRLMLEDPKPGEARRVVGDKTDYQRFHAYLTSCGVTNAAEIKRHSTRHLYAQLMAASGVSMSTLKEWLGHKKIVTTDIYTKGSALYEGIAASWGKGNLRLRQPAAAAKEG